MSHEFSAEEYIQNIITEGQKIPCDASHADFHKAPELPNYFDETKFERAQRFFHENATAMMAVSLAGLVAVLSDSSTDGAKILIATNKSSEPITACRRYLDTIFYLMSWNNGNFLPDSELWKSVHRIRRMHNAASLNANKLGISRIDQHMMSFTLFGFMGFALARPHQIGLGSASEEDLEALVHFWRVIGFVMGVEDRFSVCRESLEETRAVCTSIVDVYFRDAIAMSESHNLMLQFAVLDGMSLLIPSLDSKAFMNFVYGLIVKETAGYEDVFFPLTLREHLQMKALSKLLSMCKHTPIRKFLNSQLLYGLNLLKKYPDFVESKLSGLHQDIIFI